MAKATIRAIDLELDTIILTVETDIKLAPSADALAFRLSIGRGDWLQYHDLNPAISFKDYVIGLIKQRYADTQFKAQQFANVLDQTITW